MISAAPQSLIRVLLVEDDEDDYVLVRDALVSIGSRRMALTWMETCDDALEALVAGRHDVCLLDYRLGASTGLELLVQARQRGWRGPIILLTGVGNDELDYQAMEAGASDFLVKSQLSPTLLERSIRYSLQQGRTLEALRRSQESFRELIERLPDGICVQYEGRLIYANPALVALVGCASADDLVGHSIDELRARLLPPEDRDSCAGDCRQDPCPHSPRELQLQRATGGRICVEATHQSTMFDGKPCQVWLLRDLTERNQMQARLLQAGRLAALGTLAAGIAHEINNPLAFMMANLSHLDTELAPRLEMAGEEREELRALLAESQLGATRVRDIVRQLKMFSRAEEQVQPVPVDVHRVLESAISMAGNEIRHRALLVRDYTEAMVRVEGNEGRLGQVFINLLVNAAHAIPEGGVERNEIRVATRLRGEDVVIEVSDTGTGMSVEQRQRVFEPFFTTKPVGMGTGLGLSICHGIVASFGGRMEVESEAGRGSTFRVILRSTSQALPGPAKPAVVTTSARRGRVLVVDDEPLIGITIRRALQRHHDVETLESAREASRRLLGGDSFDVILCDLMMPEMSGVDLYHEVRRWRPDVGERIVFMTGGAFTPDTRAFLERVSNARLEKPFSYEAVRDLVLRLISDDESVGLPTESLARHGT